nr:MAG TPA: hypothetical protein [Caudoviricetes sp.]
MLFLPSGVLLVNMLVHLLEISLVSCYNWLISFAELK